MEGIRPYNDQKRDYLLTSRIHMGTRWRGINRIELLANICNGDNEPRPKSKNTARRIA